MKSKKNPNVKVGRNSSLFFAVGLNLMLLLTYYALNMKTYDKEEIAINTVELEDVLEEDIPTVNINTPPPPPPPKVATEVITIVEDMADVEETVIKSTEIQMDDVIQEAVVAVEEVKVEEEEEEVTVPFAVVEKVPIYPGCTGKTNAELKACFEKKITQHVNNNFKYPELALELGINGKVFVMFNVDSNGFVNGIRTRGPDKSLEKEAERIISLLPRMVPANQRGKPVKVPYSIPIHFKLLDQ
jgi:protein TonB